MPLAKKYGFISDIHANYAALKEVLDYLNQAGVEKILCLGDLVGYGAQPFECIQAVRDKPNIYCIAGNHDRQVIGEKDPRMRQTASRVLEWTADNISPSNARYLKQLPQGMTVDDTFIMVHGSLVERDAYILTPQEISRNFEVMAGDFPGHKLCIFGHTHYPMLIGTKKIYTDLRETKSFQLDPNDVYLVNPGSVGQPRDRCPLASFAVFDTTNWTITYVRLPYEIRQAQSAIIDNDLPEKFARRLAVGV
jgi:predicted phosphodiesterase